jgi:hypothetical protein
MARVIDEEQAAWIQSGVVSIVAASHDESLQPSVGLVHGCSLSLDAAAVRIFLLEAQSAEVIRDLRAGRPVSVLFTESLISRALQLKAGQAQEVALQAGDAALLERHMHALAAEFAEAGQAEAFTFALLDKRGDHLAAFVVCPEVAFDQSPGPGAGAALGGSS